jgi:phasin
MLPPKIEIPEQMRDAADKSVSQARKAVEQLLDATQKALASAEGAAKSKGVKVDEGAGDLSRETLAFAEQNIATSFDLAQRLVQARTIEEMTALQQEFLRRQMAAAVEQGQTLGEMAKRVAGDAMPKAGKKPGK